MPKTSQQPNLSPIISVGSLSLPPTYEGSTRSQPSSAASVATNTTTGGVAGAWNAVVRVVTGERTDSESDRSSSRGRDRGLVRSLRDLGSSLQLSLQTSPSSSGSVKASTGRGGAGNIVRSESTSSSRDGDERGREVFTPSDKVTHAGRGGEGNVRSPSRGKSKEAAEQAFEKEVIRRHRENRDSRPISAGRGGVGNITTDRSCSRSREPSIAQTKGAVALEGGVGKGGVGNIVEAKHFNSPGQAALEKLEEEDRIEAIRQGVDKGEPTAHVGHLCSSGWGGGGNMIPSEPRQVTGTSIPDPATPIATPAPAVVR